MVAEQALRRERRHADIGGVQTVEQVFHHGIACNTDARKLLLAPAAPDAQVLRHAGDLAADRVAQRDELALAGAGNAADHVRAVAALGVASALRAEALAGLQIIKEGGDCGRTDVHCEAQSLTSASDRTRTGGHHVHLLLLLKHYGAVPGRGVAAGK